MKEIGKHQLLKLIAGLPDGDQKRQLIAHLVQTKELNETEIADIVIEDVIRNLDHYAEQFRSNDLLRMLWNRFEGDPRYLARALVRIAPQLFYAYGFAYRLILKLSANLGPIVLPPRRPTNEQPFSVYLEKLPSLVKNELFSLDTERLFRQYLYLFSRDAGVAFELLSEAIKEATDTYDRGALEYVRGYSERLLQMKFPEFVEQIEGSHFPSFHVRWWIDQMANSPRVLNIGDTGTQKTAFATVAMRHYGCKRVLVLCTPHARTHWRKEIELYTRRAGDHVDVIQQAKEIEHFKTSRTRFTVIAYTTLIQPGVLESLIQIPFDGLIWDEAHYGKNVLTEAASERGKATAQLIRDSKFKHVLALTATQWENHPKEFAAIATALEPTLFPTAADFQQARPEDPRFLRELFSSKILEVELREIVDLPPITPKPWEDLFGAELIEPTPLHRAVYHHVREDEATPLLASQKVQRLVLTAIHPHKVEQKYDWPPHLAAAFQQWQLSTKLCWIKERVTAELKQGAKVAIATGIYVEGITRPEDAEDEEEIWVGKLLQEWFGPEHVLILDQRISTQTDASGTSARDRLIQRWRSDPEARILLVSMRTCPDSINLSVPKLPGVKKLFLTALSYPWIPWKQFLGRWWRRGLGVPMQYCVPVLRGTIDEDILLLGRRKWQTQQLFRADVPLSAEELSYLDKQIDIRKLAEQSRSDLQKVNLINAMVQGRGEHDAMNVLGDAYGTSTNAEIFARAFLARQEYGASGHISRFMATIIHRFIDQGLIHAPGIFDAGCGPLTLERRLNEAVYGVDMNPSMIAVGRAASHHNGHNAQVGFLSALSPEWKGRFELTVSSLVLDWTSLSAQVDGIPERLRILSELVRVTHPHGRVWITATEHSLEPDLLASWVKGLESQGFTIVHALTGLVTATSHPDAHAPFAFWSICFSPSGKQFVSQNAEDYRFLFETERTKRKRGKTQEPKTAGTEKRIEHHEFKVAPLSGISMEMTLAAEQAAEKEILRLIATPGLGEWKFHRAPQLPWRVVQQLYARGLLHM